MSDWYRSGEDVTHYCSGYTEKEKQNKPSGTQKATTAWFNPAELKDDTFVCKACGVAVPTTTCLIDMD